MQKHDVALLRCASVAWYMFGFEFISAELIPPEMLRLYFSSKWNDAAAVATRRFLQFQELSSSFARSAGFNEAVRPLRLSILKSTQLRARGPLSQADGAPTAHQLFDLAALCSQSIDSSATSAARCSAVLFALKGRLFNGVPRDFWLRWRGTVARASSRSSTLMSKVFVQANNKIPCEVSTARQKPWYLWSWGNSPLVRPHISPTNCAWVQPPVTIMVTPGG